MQISLQFGHAQVTMKNNNISKHNNMSKTRNERFFFFFKT